MTTGTLAAELSHPIGTDGLFVLRVHDGDIRIRGIDGDVATIRATDGGRLDGLDVESGDRSLSVRSRRGADFFGFGRDRGRRARDLHIEVPAGATIVIEGASADVDVRGMHGDQRYRSASGDLVLLDVRGSLTIDSVSGDIEIAADGPSTIAARTVSGDLDLRAGSILQLRATTTSGDLQVSGRFDGDGPYAIETVSGDARLAPANDVRIEARTIAGDIDSELPSRRDDVAAGRRGLIIGDGGPTISFRSTSGDLRVVATGSVRPARPPEPPAPPARGRPSAPRTPARVEPPDRAAGAGATEADDRRLDILRALERGEIDVAEAGRRLEALEGSSDAGSDSQGEDDHA